jgi:hypothetical protein
VQADAACDLADVGDRSTPDPTRWVSSRNPPTAPRTYWRCGVPVSTSDENSATPAPQMMPASSSSRAGPAACYSGRVSLPPRTRAAWPTTRRRQLTAVPPPSQAAGPAATLAGGKCHASSGWPAAMAEVVFFANCFGRWSFLVI